MVTGELRSQIDRIWNDFWSGGISNPLEVIEQLTYLLFIKRLDDLQILAENKAKRLGTPIEESPFPDGVDDRGRSYQDYRWSQFKNLAPAEMFEVIDQHVFPFLRTLGGEGSTYATHMRDARFTIPTPALLQKAVDGLDHVNMDGRDTKGDVYEYMLAKIATAGQNGQFRTPRHIIQLMVEMTAPVPTDVICDPAAGTCGFLVAAGEYVRDRHPDALRDQKSLRHFHDEMFNGFDFDNTMLRIGSILGRRTPDPTHGDRIAGCEPLWRKYLSESGGDFLQWTCCGPIPPRTVAKSPEVTRCGPATAPSSRPFPVVASDWVAAPSPRRSQAHREATL